MDYSLEVIREDLLRAWEGPEFCLLKYYSKRSGLDNETTRLILDFKSNDAQAVKIAVDLAVSAFADMVDLLSNRRACRYIVAIPPSSKGKPHRSGERVCRELADHFNWLKHIPAALERVESVQKSAYAFSGKRPGYDDHRRTIRYKGPPLSIPEQSIIMFDDVLTRGATAAACRAILKEATDCRSVFGIYLGRTQ